MSAAASQRVASIAQAGLRSASRSLSRFLEADVTAEGSIGVAGEPGSVESALADPEAILCCATMVVLLAGATERQDVSEPQPSLTEGAGRLLLAWSPESAAEWIALALQRDQVSNDPGKWNEMERSALSETANVLGCAFLNFVTKAIEEHSHERLSMLPTTPYVTEEFAGSLMQAAVSEVEARPHPDSHEQIWLASSCFQVIGESLETKLVMIWQPWAWQRLAALVEKAA